MKNNTDALVQRGAEPTTAPGISVRPAGLKLLTALTALSAGWLTYQVAAESIALHLLLDKTRDAMSVVLPIRTPAVSGAKITETKPRVTGL
jgi:hypothetical protein